jgi:C_GCAxxG_C_C family probable redox protein
LNKIIDLQKIKTTAEDYYRNGEFFCSESILKTIKDEFGLPISDDIIAIASGFPVGMGGAGCTCGAVVGGIMSIGLFFGRSSAKDTKVVKAMTLSKELHDIFRKQHKCLCCRVLTKDMLLGSPEHMDQCVRFTGEVAVEAAKIIIRELELGVNMIVKSIENPDLFKILDKSTHKMINGCNQEWYNTEWQRRSGCGPTTASALIFYINHSRSIFESDKSIPSNESCLSLMEEVWEYVTPTKEGIPTTKMFYEDVLAYTRSKGLNVNYNFLDLPIDISKRPTLSEVLNFLQDALSNDAPIAFLNLCNGEEKELQRWHWVTIISLEYSEDGKSAFVNILDEELIKKVDLALWYNSTKLGGGFVYFTVV